MHARSKFWLLVLIGFGILVSSTGFAEPLDWTYTYDAAGRLTGVTQGSNSVAYAYDGAGNIVSVPEPTGAASSLFALVTLALLLRRSRAARRGGAAALALALLHPTVSGAHDLDTTKVRLNDLNATATFTLADEGTCAALITATSQDPNVATVTPAGPISAVTQTFTVTSRTAETATTTILLSWIGEDAGGEGPCQEMVSNKPVEVCVKPREFTTGETTAPSIAPEDPVDSSTGEFFAPQSPELVLGGPMNLRFQRFYASELERDGYSVGTMGNGWRHNFDWLMRSYGNKIEIVSASGDVIVFEDSLVGIDQGPWVLTDDTEIPYQLIGTQFGAEYTFFDPRSKRLYIFNNPFALDVVSPLKRIEDIQGNTLTVTQGANGVSSVSDGLGRVLTFSYTSGLLTSVSDGTRTVTLAFTGDNLTTVTDALGEDWLYTYDLGHSVDGLMTSAVAPRGNARVQLTWDVEGRVATQTDGVGNVTSVNLAAGKTTVTQPLGQPIEHDFNSDGKLTDATDEDGGTYSFTYDADGRRITLTNGNQDTASVTYDPASGLPTTFVDYDGGTTTLTYESRVHSSGITLSDLIRIDHADGTIELFSYTNGNPTSSTNRLGETYTSTYGSKGEVLTVTLPTGGIYTATYNPDGTPATFTDPAGDSLTYGYDSLRRRVSVTYPDTSAIVYELDDRNAVTRRTDREGNAAIFTYDPNGNVATATTPLGETTTFAYDGMERILSATAPNLSAVSRTYDALGRIDTQTDLNGNTWTLQLDGRGAAIGITDPENNTWTRSIGAEGQVDSETDPLGNTTLFQTNNVGLLTRATTPLGHVTDWSYGPADDLESITSPLGNVWRFDFRPNQQAAEIGVGDDLVITTWSHGDLERVETITDPNGRDWTRTHDNQGRLLSVTDPLGNSIGFASDRSARTETLTFPSGLGTLVREHNRNGGPTRQTYSDGTVIDFGYNANGDLVSATGLTLDYDSQRLIDNSNGIEVDRDAGGNISSISYGTNLDVTYAYDGTNRAVSISDWLGGTTNLTYDAEGKLVSIQRPNGVTTTWTWDDDGRLARTVETRSATTLSDIQLTRDGRGQISAATRDVPLAVFPSVPDASFSYDAASQSNDHSYDAMGRTTTVQGGRSYQWDLAGRLTQIDDGQSPVEFTYDGLGQPLTRTESGTTRSWVWNYALPLPVLAIERQDTNDVRYYVHLPGGALLYSIEASGGARHYYHHDEMGNALFRTSDAGAVTESYAYAPYGEIIGSAEVSENRFAFQAAAGHIREGSDLVFMRARWYDSSLGRFLSRDPRNESISPLETMPYSYARQNPLLYVDPRGTNVTVVEGGIHTDIQVDVWCGNQIIGTLTAGFFPKCVANRRPTATAGLETITYGADSAIKGRFHFGNKVTPPSKTGNSSGNVFIRGFKPADERLALQILKWMGHDPGDQSAGEFLKELYPVAKGQKNKSFSFLVDSTDSYGGYRIFTQVCNDFTDEALDTYYGHNWYLGTFWLGATLVDQVRDYETLRGQGLPLGGFIYQDLVPALFGGG